MLPPAVLLPSDDLPPLRNVLRIIGPILGGIPRNSNSSDWIFWISPSAIYFLLYVWILALICLQKIRPCRVGGARQQARSGSNIFAPLLGFGIFRLIYFGLGTKGWNADSFPFFVMYSSLLLAVPLLVRLSREEPMTLECSY